MYFTFAKQSLTNGCISRNAFSLTFLYLRKTFLLLEPNVQNHIEMLCYNTLYAVKVSQEPYGFHVMKSQ